MPKLLSELVPWSLIAVLTAGFIATTAHLTVLIVLPRAWKLASLSAVAGLLLPAAVADKLR